MEKQSVAPADPSLGSELEFFRSVAFDGLINIVAAATIYFFFIMAVLAKTAPAALLSPLLIQKSLYAAVLLSIYWGLKTKRIIAKQYNAVMSLVLGLCLTSGLITAAFGINARVGTYSVILILACALVEISYPWAVLHWALIWFGWYSVTVSLPEAQVLDEFAKLIGIQLIALVAMNLRIRLYRTQYRTLEQLAGALTESEQVRANLDLEVENRTGQLKWAYEELRLSVEERERIANEQEKLHEQLLQSQKMESLGRLAGGVAHDFNNLLTIITGSLELARMEGELSPEVDELLKDSGTAAARAADLTGQLLAFSRKQVMKITPFKIQGRVEDSIKLVERLLGEDVKLVVGLNCPDIVVEGDPSQFQQVLLNLVVNARDAMPTGGTLAIRLRRVDNEVELSVSDTGQGIAPEQHDRIFEPFFTSKPVGTGTGLGLSTVHGIVNKHKGRIEVESALGEGAKFLVLLPIANPDVEDSAANRAVPALRGTGNIMLVEDDHQVRGLAVRVLRSAGYHVRDFEDAEHALASMDEAQDYDLLVTDVVMPGMDGGKLAEAVRARMPELPVLFMSGYTDDRLSSFGILRRDDCGFLAKPFTPILLQKAVADILRERSAVAIGTL